MASSQQVAIFRPATVSSTAAAKDCSSLKICSSRVKLACLSSSSSNFWSAASHQPGFALGLVDESLHRPRSTAAHASYSPIAREAADDYLERDPLARDAPGPPYRVPPFPARPDEYLERDPLARDGPGPPYRIPPVPARPPPSRFQGQDQQGNAAIWTRNGGVQGGRRMSQTAIDRWPPTAGRLVEEEDVTEILERLKEVEETVAGVERALEGWNKKLSSRTLVAILKVMEGWQKPYAFFSWAKTKPFCEVTVFTYNVVLRNLRQGVQYDLAESLVEEMFAKGIQPDNYTYSTIISCANTARRSDSAIKWYETMYQRGCPPDEITHSAMMDAYSKQGRLNEAYNIYESLRERGWRPDRISYGMVVSTLGRVGKNLEAFEMYQEMLNDGIQPSVNLQNYMARVLVKLGRLVLAKDVYERIVADGNIPSELTLTSLIDGFGKAQEYEEVLNLYNKARAEKWPLDIVNYQCVIKHCSESYNVAEGTRVFNDMMATYQPTAWTYKTMVHLYAKTGRMKEAMDMYSQLIAAGNEPDIVCFTCLVQGYGNSGEFAKMEEVFQLMLDKGLQSDEKFVGAVLAVLSACKTDDQRAVCFRILEKSDQAMCSIAQQLCGNEHLEVEDVQEAVSAVIRGYSQVAQQRYFNFLADLCKRTDHADRGRQLMKFAFIAGGYPGLQVRFAPLWSLRLSALSVAAAEYALEWWVDVLQASFSQGLYLPQKFRIELLSPKMEKAASLEGSTLHVEKLEVVRSVLEAVKAPFEQAKGDGIWFETTLDDVRPWLWFRETEAEENQDTTGMVTARFEEPETGDPTQVAPESNDRVPEDFS